MSFDTYAAFEESLKASRTRKRIPNVNKTVLKKVIQSTDAYNRNLQEQEMWSRHFASKETRNRDSSRSSDSDRNKISKPKKSKKKKSRRREENRTDKRIQSSLKSKTQINSNADSEIGPSVNGFLTANNLKWGHDGYHELYENEDSIDSNIEDKKLKKNKKKKKRKKPKSESSDSDSNFDRKRRKKSKKH
ncbi:uncharacterized protein LOC120335112 [Styela clava]